MKTEFASTIARASYPIDKVSQNRQIAENGLLKVKHQMALLSYAPICTLLPLTLSNGSEMACIRRLDCQ